MRLLLLAAALVGCAAPSVAPPSPSAPIAPTSIATAATATTSPTPTTATPSAAPLVLPSATPLTTTGLVQVFVWGRFGGTPSPPYRVAFPPRYTATLGSMLITYGFQGGTRFDSYPPDVLLTPDAPPLAGTGRTWYSVLSGSRDAIFVWYGSEGTSIAAWHDLVQGLFGSLTYTAAPEQRQRLGRFEYVRQDLTVAGLGKRSTATLPLSNGGSFYFTTTNEAAIPDLVRVLETFDIRG